MISRTLKQAEENYATNEKELLAIVWTLGKLQRYLYGSRELHIYTDHQPLIFAVSEKNTNAKIKRWKAKIEEYDAKIHYEPGKENFVADTLSRQNVNALINCRVCTKARYDRHQKNKNSVRHQFQKGQEDACTSIFFRQIIRNS